MTRRINPSESANLATITRACLDGRLALVVVREKATKTERVALAAVGGGEEDGYEIVPFALMIDGDPFELLDPPEAQ